MSKLVKQSIKIESLDPAHFFQSLLEEAYHKNMISDDVLSGVQVQSLQLLSELTEQLTGGASSSLPVEKAQGLLQSIFYTIGLTLKNSANKDACLALVKEEKLKTLYEKGKVLLKEKVGLSEKKLIAIQENRLQTKVEAYNDTIDNGLPLFFSSYDLEYAAHDIPAGIDYPLSHDQMLLTGVEYIEDYLHKLWLENEFCKKFLAQDLHRLLQGYHEHYEGLLINIFAIVITNLVGSTLAKKDLCQLMIDQTDIEKIKQQLANLHQNKLGNHLKDATGVLCRYFCVKDSFMQNYIEITAQDITARLNIGLKEYDLAKLFISFNQEGTSEILEFSEGQMLTNEAFRILTEEIRSCRFVSDKLTIIQQEVCSISDLVDLLGACCLFDDEYTELFHTLDDTVLAFLIQRLPTQDCTEVYDYFPEHEKEWHEKFRQFLCCINSVRRKKLQYLADQIRRL